MAYGGSVLSQETDRSENFRGKEVVEINRLTCSTKWSFIFKGVFPDMLRPTAHLHLNRMHLAALQRHRNKRNCRVLGCTGYNGVSSLA